ncbi:MAG: class I SAM-dependent methyltransferase [candidate division WOR-3 bacterium]|nr:class I SAM-dependent methyltransferase [candidate division WOR-3 bacterium]
MASYHQQYFEHIDQGYYPFSYLRDKVIVNFIKKHIPFGGRILEFGCGTGRLITKLERDYETYGVDISEYAINQAQKKSKTTKFYLNLDDFMLLNKNVDAILAINVIEHIADPEGLLQKFNAILKRCGYLFIHLPVASNQLTQFLVKRFYHDETHVFVPSIDELDSILFSNGFKLKHRRSGSFIFLPISMKSIIKITPCYFGVYKKSY